MPGPRLLIVDDETALLSLLKRYLERAGYQVDLAANPEEALQLFEPDPHAFACVLTDLSMPQMNGEELVERLRAKNPNLRAVISSGYPYEPRGKATRFLQKPYLPQMLVETLQSVLGRAAPR